MRCTEFRDQHCSYIDDTLPGIEIVRMQSHIFECKECADLDARVRRSLLVIRTLAPIESIEPSADFSQRLEAKLRRAREEQAGSAARSAVNYRTFALLGAVASVAMMAYVAEVIHRAGEDVVLPPVAVRAIRPDTTPASEIVASVSAGIPLWAATLVVEQRGEPRLQTASLTR